MFIQGVYKPTAAALRPVRGGRVGGRFRVPEAQAEAAEASSGTVAVSMPSLLAMQEAESAALQDRDAKRHGTAVLDELAGLQRALLGPDGPDLDRLAQLADRPAHVSDPALGGVLSAIQLRARIE